jgi:hypothetical protein
MMTRVHVLTAGLFALLLAMAGSVEAQTKTPKMTAAEILAAVKPGQWIKMEGIVQKDFSVLCLDVKILTGDFLDDDWSLSAPVRKINKEKQEVVILLLPITVQKDAVFENDAGTFKSFADLKVNMLAQVKGTYLKEEGTFLARKVDDDSAKLAGEPNLINEVEARGKVEKIDAANRTITLMGITFKLTDKTKGKKALR